MTLDQDKIFDIGFKVITIQIGEDQIPKLDLGDCSLFEAQGILTAALESVNLITPICPIAANGIPLLVVEAEEYDE